MVHDKVTVLKGPNYLRWRYDIEITIQALGLWEIVSGTRKSPGNTNKDPDFATDNFTALKTIIRSLDDTYIQYIIGVKCAKKAFDTIVSVFENKAEYNKSSLSAAYYSTKYEGDIRAYFAKLRDYLNKLKALSVKYDDSQVLGKVINDLPDTFASFKTLFGMLVAKDSSYSMSLDEAEAQLVAIEKGPSLSDNTPPNQAALSSGASRNNNSRRPNGHTSKSSQQGNSANKFCAYCKKRGHSIDACFKRKRTSPPNASSKSQSVSLSMADGKSSLDFYADTAASWHTTFDRSIFTEYKEIDYDDSILTAKGRLKVHGIGTAKCQFWNGEEWIDGTLNNIKYVPESDFNLFSIGVLPEEVMTVIHRNEMTLYLNNRPILAGYKNVTRMRNLFSIYIKFESEQQQPSTSASLATVDDIAVHHERLVHISPRRVAQMAADQSVVGLPPKLKGKITFCKPCKQGKMTDISHKPSSSPKSHLSAGEFIHTDICGYKDTSIHGNRYFLLIKCDLTGYRKVYFMKQKSEALKCLKRFANELKLETGTTTIRKIRSDQGSEFLSAAFQEYVDQHSIVHELATKGTPQQNGKAERDNRNLVEHATSILAKANMKSTFWDEALNTVAYTLNRVTSGNDKVTPYEKWFGTKPDISHLRIFGSPGQALDNVKRPKFQTKTKDVIMLGYSDSPDIYRVYVPSSRSVQTISAVSFDEQPECKREFPVRKKVFEPSSNSATESSSDSSDSDEPSASSKGRGGDSCQEEIVSAVPELGKQTNKAKQKRTKKVKQPDPARLATLRPRTAKPPTAATTTVTASTDTNKAIAPSTSSLPSKQGNAKRSPVPSRSSSSSSASSNSNESSSSGANSSSADSSGSEDAPLNTADIAVSPDDAYVSVALIVPSGDEPFTFDEAMHSEDRELWIRAMQEELNSIEQNQTWRLVDRPQNARPIGVKWVFKIKRVNGRVRYKARLVALGYAQRPGIDFGETYAPVIRVSTVRILLSIAATLDMEIIQFDVSTAFLNGSISEEIYLQQPPGFNDQSGRVCRLQRGLYGLRQSPRAWNKRFNRLMLKCGLRRSEYDPCVYWLNHPDHGLLIVALYVDDGLIMAQSNQLLQDMLQCLQRDFQITSGPVGTYVGLEITRHRESREIVVSQSAYIERKLLQFDMTDAIPQPTPLDVHSVPRVNNNTGTRSNFPYREAIGSLVYLATQTRPDIAHAVSVLSRYSNNPSQAHINAVKRIFRYLSGTRNRGITLGNSLNLIAFSDSDWAGDLDSRRSTTGYVISYGGPVAWFSRLQPTVALSTCEAEYIAMSECARSLMWIRNFLNELQLLPAVHPIPLFCDNRSAVAQVLHDTITERVRHVDIKFHFLRLLARNEILDIEWIKSDEQRADGLTKALNRVAFSRFLSYLDTLLFL